MSSIRFFGILSLLVLISLGASASKNIGSAGKTRAIQSTEAAGCAPASSTANLNLNNVRCELLGGGDKWWDLTSAKYEVPKITPEGSAPSVCSIFAGAIWMGGIDAAGQLKIAAMTYRQNGDDYFPGPLTDQATTNLATCNLYDVHWQVFGSEIDSFRSLNFPVDPNFLLGSPTYKNIIIWPGKGNPYAQGADGVTITPTIDQDLAPYYDANDNGVYDPWNGDYPVINPTCGTTYADQMVFWCYNDEGNIHTETGGQAIGVMVGELAFAFITSDEINSMTFYRYQITNKADIPVGQFYMGQWVDPDLGCYTNDYVGCDTTLKLGYCYNGYATDADCGVPGYHDNIPIVGADYFEGPFDDSGVQLGMSTFTYYNNDFTVQGNPTSAVNYYDYMVGFWKDGSPFTSDKCDAYGGKVPTHYQFPSDPGGAAFPATWSECSCNDPVGDRRFLQASGPFTLNPGAINDITVGMVWVQQGNMVQQGCDANVGLLKIAAQKAQALFNSCFKVIEGPDAPDIAIRELRNEVILTLSNKVTSNNYQESYKEADPTIEAIALTDTISHIDTTYTFQGYAIYQLANSSISASNLADPTQARLVAEVDEEDTVIHMVNYVLDHVLGLVGTYYPPQQENLTNTGITHTFNVTQDLFASGNPTLVDYQTYYFCAVAFAHNYYTSKLTGQYQQTPYLQGNKNFQVYSAIPHDPGTDQHGTILNSAYGDSIPVRRLDGAGNGGYALDLVTGFDDSILNSSNGFYGPIVYQGNHSPISVHVVDPYAVQSRNFVVSFLPTDSPGNLISYDTIWAFNPHGHTDSVRILNFITPKVKFKVDVYDSINGTAELEASDTSYRDIAIPNDFLPYDSNANGITLYGISITLGQVPNVGDTTASTLGFIEATISFQDSLNAWLTGVQEQGENEYQNWIRSGNYAEAEECPTGAPPAGYSNGFWDDYYIRFGDVNSKGCNADTTVFYDPLKDFGDMLGGTFSPYCLASNMIDADIDTGTGTPYTSPYSYGPGFTVDYQYATSPLLNYSPGYLRQNYRCNDNTLRSLQSVDLVFTPNKNEWSQCVVLEMDEDSSITEGHALKGFYRQSPSLDINANVVTTGDSGRSYFPGYAINLETGERLNIMFGEDSWLKNENGGDMIWNPTQDVVSPLGQVLFGGRHCIYIMDTRYDGGQAVHDLMQAAYDNLPDPVTNVPDSAYTWLRGTKPNVTGIEYLNTMNDKVYDHIMWVTMPTLDTTYAQLNPNFSVAGTQLIPPTETRIRLRVNKPFMPYAVNNAPNQGFPQYSFSTKGVSVDTAIHPVAVNALDSIRVVPNPYYAYSAYEISQLDNEVKITNLPPNCTISIYTIDGTLIRRFQRAIGTDNTSQGTSTENTNLDNSQNWNLTNTANIPIASGVYLIYVTAPGLGEKVIKWFGVLRPTDLNTF